MAVIHFIGPETGLAPSGVVGVFKVPKCIYHSVSTGYLFLGDCTNVTVYSLSPRPSVGILMLMFIYFCLASSP